MESHPQSDVNPGLDLDRLAEGVSLHDGLPKVPVTTPAARRSPVWEKKLLDTYVTGKWGKVTVPARAADRLRHCLRVCVTALSHDGQEDLAARLPGPPYRYICIYEVWEARGAKLMHANIRNKIKQEVLADAVLADEPVDLWFQMRLPASDTGPRTRAARRT